MLSNVEAEAEAGAMLSKMVEAEVEAIIFQVGQLEAEVVQKSTASASLVHTVNAFGGNERVFCIH